ncbi:MAG: beta-galactosidase [Desulfobacterales bacterium]|nr:beta-galactosidase [Desulfobacterales bacterium]
MIGVYYYPEQWPPSQWERDIQNIAKMGMTHIHMAEFSWIHLEPEENQYEFSWLDRAVDLARACGLGVILCTPTATPPIWMSHAYPDILMVKDNGRRVTHGSRAHRCVNTPLFNRFSEKITRKLGERYGRNKSIIGWQLDNEIGHYASAPCYCEACLSAFRTYLTEKYRDIHELNHAWAGDFWSQNLQDFSQVQLPNPRTLPYLPNEHALLDFKRFFSISLSRFLERQSRVLKPLIHENAWVTHNFMKDDDVHFPGHVEGGLDMYALTIYPVAGIFKGEPKRELHRIGDPVNIAFHHDLMRSFNGRWGILEQQPGQVNWGPCNLRPWPGSTRLWLWTAIAHGAELLSTYRYRQPLGGAEQFHKGMVGPDGITLTRGGRDFARVARELESFKADLENPPVLPLKKAAIYMDWSSLTALTIHPQSDFFNGKSCWLNYYSGLKRLGFDVDILSMDRPVDLSVYSVVCTGLYDLADDRVIDAWNSYAEQGGHLVITLRTATRMRNGHFPEMPYGRRVTDLTGTEITGYDVMPDGHEGKIKLIRSGETIPWQSWAEQYHPLPDATFLATFSDQFYKGDCAAFKTKKGKGTITSIGFDQKPGIHQLMHDALNEDLPETEPLPDHTLFSIRGCLGIFLNYSDRAVKVPAHLYQQGKIVSGDPVARPCDVILIRYGS